MSREFSNLSSQEVVETGVSGLTAAESTTHSLINDIWGQLGTIEGSASHKMMMRVLFAATCGKLDMTDHGDGTYTMHMRDMMDGKDRITFTGPIEGGRDTASWDMS